VTQDEQQRVQRIKDYVLERLRQDLKNTPRGGQAQLAKRLGVSGAHLSNMLSPNPTRQPGEDFRRKVAAHWGVSYAQLEALALGESIIDSGTRLAPPGSSEGPQNLSLVLCNYQWMSELPIEARILVQEQARLHYQFAGVDYENEEWQRIVTGLEREILGLLAWRHRSDTKPKEIARPRGARR